MNKQKRAIIITMKSQGKTDADIARHVKVSLRQVRAVLDAAGWTYVTGFGYVCAD